MYRFAVCLFDDLQLFVLRVFSMLVKVLYLTVYKGPQTNSNKFIFRNTNIPYNTHNFILSVRFIWWCLMFNNESYL